MAVFLTNMLTCFPGKFVQLLGEITKLEGHFHQCSKYEFAEAHKEYRNMSDPHVVMMMAYSSQLEDICQEHGLVSSAEKCARIYERGRQARIMPIPWGEGHALMRDLRERIEDDLKTQLIAHLSPKEAELYTSPTKDWTAVVERFPRVKTDVEECSKCFALTRYAASIFHAMLVAEIGIIEIAKLLEVTGDKPGCGCLERLERILDKPHHDRSPIEQKYSTLLTQIVPLTSAMKDSWRHRISHVENKLVWLDSMFDEEIAAEIISATRGFMRRLATDWPG